MHIWLNIEDRTICILLTHTHIQRINILWKLRLNFSNILQHAFYVYIYIQLIWHFKHPETGKLHKLIKLATKENLIKFSSQIRNQLFLSFFFTVLTNKITYALIQEDVTSFFLDSNHLMYKILIIEKHASFVLNNC